MKDEQAQDYWFCYTRKLNDIEAKSFLYGDVEKIKASHAYVKCAVEMHGDAIFRAWRKRSPAKRAVLLQEVEPKIAKRKGLNMDLSIAGLNCESDWSPYRKNLLVPYLDVETLAKIPATFVGLT